ncbi:MAG: hypothetical protein R6X09_00105 [Bacteroidales bacterium]
MNKLMLLLLALCCTILPGIAQDHYQQLYERKVETFTKVRNGGIVMTGIGAGLAMTGTVLLATLPSGYWETEDDYYYNEDEESSSSDDLKAAFGILSIGIGVGLLAGGITMSSIGSRKIKYYQGKANTLSFGIKSQGFTLTYKF